MMRFKEFVYSQEVFEARFISSFITYDQLTEAVIKVDKHVESIINQLNKIEEPSIENITKTLNVEADIKFKEDNTIESLSGFNSKENNEFNITILYNKNYILDCFKQKKFRLLYRQIAWIVGHEMIHNIQHKDIPDDVIRKHRTIDIKDTKKYYSNIHEIMAFAYNIYEEVKDEIGAKELPNVILNQPKNLIMFSDRAKEFFEAFDYDFTDKHMKQLLKYLYDYAKSKKGLKDL